MLEWNLIILSEVNSTNDYLKELGKSGAVEGTAVLATGQSAGRGRLERTWDSPLGLGLYLSWLLRPPKEFDSFELLNVLSGVPVAQKLRELFNLEITLKWSNDLVVNGKKLGGLLGETVRRGKEECFMVIGLGINCRQQKGDFLTDLRDTATSLALAGITNSRPKELAPLLLESFKPFYEDFVQGHHQTWIDNYRRLSCTLGERVRKDDLEGVAIGIGRRGELVVELDDGKQVQWEL